MNGGEAEALEAQRRLAAHFAQMLEEDEEELQDESDMKEVQAEAPKDPEVISEGDDGHSFKLFSGTVHLQRIRLLGLDETGLHTATTRPEHYYEWSPDTEDLVRDQCRLASVTASEIVSWAQHATPCTKWQRRLTHIRLATTAPATPTLAKKRRKMPGKKQRTEIKRLRAEKKAFKAMKYGGGGFAKKRIHS